MKIGKKQVVDAKKRLRTTITAADNAIAVQTDPTHCAVAESLRRRNDVDSVSIGASKAYVVFSSKPDRIVRYALPKQERVVIRAFDQVGVFPEGYTITLAAIPVGQKIGARKGQKSGSNKRSGNGRSALNQVARRTPTRHVASPGK